MTKRRREDVEEANKNGDPDAAKRRNPLDEGLWCWANRELSCKIRENAGRRRLQKGDVIHWTKSEASETSEQIVRQELTSAERSNSHFFFPLVRRQLASRE